MAYVAGILRGNQIAFNYQDGIFWKNVNFNYFRKIIYIYIHIYIYIYIHIYIKYIHIYIYIHAAFKVFSAELLFAVGTRPKMIVFCTFKIGPFVPIKKGHLLDVLKIIFIFHLNVFQL